MGRSSQQSRGATSALYPSHLILERLHSSMPSDLARSLKTKVQSTTCRQEGALWITEHSCLQPEVRISAIKSPLDKHILCLNTLVVPVTLCYVHILDCYQFLYENNGCLDGNNW